MLKILGRLFDSQRHMHRVADDCLFLALSSLVFRPSAAISSDFIKRLLIFGHGCETRGIRMGMFQSIVLAASTRASIFFTKRGYGGLLPVV